MSLQATFDTVFSAEVLGFLRKSADLGQTIVMVTHDAVAASYADRAIVFADGQIVADVAGSDAETMNALLVREQRKQLLHAWRSSLTSKAVRQWPGSGAGQGCGRCVKETVKL